MLEEFMNVMIPDDTLTQEEQQNNIEVKNLIDGLEMFSNDPRMLTNMYTDIFSSDNVVYLMTRISQYPIFKEHFPEFYIKNENGESVINCQQNTPYHRYGVFRHILYTMEYVAKDDLKYSRNDMKILKWTMFLHDIGKPFTKTTNSEGRDSFAGHDDMSVQIAEPILDRLYFSEKERKTILQLIKYHDRYLNEGELTYDNLSFLAQELDNKKELFQMLIDVKIADNRAKSLDVYNKFLTVVPKYTEFLNNHFKDIEMEGLESVEDELLVGETKAVLEEELLVPSMRESQITKEEPKIEIEIEPKHKIEEISEKEATEEDFETEYNCILKGIDINYTYKPVIDSEKKEVFGYEVISKLKSTVSLKSLKDIAKKKGKYEKINQLLLINELKVATAELSDKNTAILLKCDYLSFEKYNNKNRIYDMLDKFPVILCFENYDKSNRVDMNKLFKEIKLKHGRVCLYKYEDYDYTIKDLANTDTDFVLCDTNTKNVEKLNEIIEFCSTSTKQIVLTGIDTDEKLNMALDKKCALLHGSRFIYECERPQLTAGDIEKIF